MSKKKITLRKRVYDVDEPVFNLIQKTELDLDHYKSFYNKTIQGPTGGREVIMILFTLRGQSFTKIKKHLSAISRRHPVLLLHGFMDRHSVIQNEFDTKVIDALDKYFPFQIPMNKCGKLDREAMISYAKECGASVFVLGDIKDGVEKEVELLGDYSYHHYLLK